MLGRGWRAVLFIAVLGPVQAKANDVDLELILAVDVSTSVDTVEAAQQRNGYLAALAHPLVISAIENGPLGRIAVLYVEWAGQHYQRRVLGWSVIDGPESAARFIAELAQQPISSRPSTSISGLIDFARREFPANDFSGRRQVVDISGDGPNSDGRRVEFARNDAVSEGLTINGLAIVNARRNPSGDSPAAVLDSYYLRRVIGGPDAFVMVADFEDFAPVILDKLLREISTAPVELSQRRD